MARRFQSSTWPRFVDGRTPNNADLWNKIFETIDLGIHGIEVRVDGLQAADDAIYLAGLRRVDEIFQPAFAELQSLLEAVAEGPVVSVNGGTGAVVLDAGDIAPTATRQWITPTDRTYLDAGIPAALALKADLSRVRRQVVLVTTASTIAEDIHAALVRCDGEFALGLSTDAATGTWWLIENAGTAVVTLDPAGGTLIDGLSTLRMYPRECRLVIRTDTAFVSTVVRPFDATFDESGTFYVPPGYASLDIDAHGAGGGGAAGRCADAGTGRRGGTGGGGGERVVVSIPAPTAGSTVTVTIGAGGIGGVGVNTQVTFGAAGSDGGNTSFGAHVVARGGKKGVAQPGDSTGGAGGGASAEGLALAGAGFSGAIGGGATGGVGTPVAAAGSPSVAAGCGGGAGGGLSTADATTPAAAGATRALGTVAGGSDASPGTDGTIEGSGGGGGGPSGGDGGDGAIGGGGGGGGGSLTGSTAGDGGTGGDGICRIRGGV